MALEHWIWLQNIGLTQNAVWELFVRFEDPEKIYNTDPLTLQSECLLEPSQTEILENKRALEPYRRVIDICDKQRITIVTFTDTYFPRRLRYIKAAPIVLYTRGDIRLLTQEVPFAVVGSRTAGMKMLLDTQNTARELSKAGFVIVSGMAKGADAAAHRGALRENGATIAVLGNGPDICYPSENMKLMDEIVEKGCVVSEYVPGTRASRLTFPQRNRIVSGISSGVLVACAPKKSGTLITASYAKSQGKRIYVIPGAAGDEEFAGSMLLLRHGAEAVSDGYMIAERERENDEPLVQCAPRRVSAAAVKREKKYIETPEEPDGVEGRIITAIKKNAVKFDSIAAAVCMEADSLMLALTQLEMKGLIEIKNGKYSIT